MFDFYLKVDLEPIVSRLDIIIAKMGTGQADAAKVAELTAKLKASNDDLEDAVEEVKVGGSS